MRLFSQSFLYDDPWSIVSLAYFLRYPNPYASHVVSCDVVARKITPCGTLLTTRLILKRGALPQWFPRGIVSRAESWVIEESEVDPFGRILRCETKNLDHVKVMQVKESTELHEIEDGKTLQTTQARFVSGFGWGLTKRIENHGLAKFKANIQRSREGVSLVLQALRESRLQTMGFVAEGQPAKSLGAPCGNSFENLWQPSMGPTNNSFGATRSNSSGDWAKTIKTWASYLRWK